MFSKIKQICGNAVALPGFDPEAAHPLIERVFWWRYRGTIERGGLAPRSHPLTFMWQMTRDHFQSTMGEAWCRDCAIWIAKEHPLPETPPLQIPDEWRNILEGARP